MLAVGLARAAGKPATAPTSPPPPAPPPAATSPKFAGSILAKDIDALAEASLEDGGAV